MTLGKLSALNATMCVCMSGRVQDSLRELETLSNRSDVNLCSLLALVHGHRKAKSVGVYHSCVAFTPFSLQTFAVC